MAKKFISRFAAVALVLCMALAAMIYNGETTRVAAASRLDQKEKYIYHNYNSYPKDWTLTQAKPPTLP